MAGPATHQGHGVTSSASYIAHRPVLPPRLPSRDASDEVYHVHPSCLLEQAGSGRRPLARPAVDDHGPLGDLGGPLTKVLKRDVDAAADRLPLPLALGTDV